ncbi:hypothetical protein JRQ81_005878 [Phrynocephalus forsythii]|uniref:Uncharacterized protein n=1 Tax=Phrynocephalus forsythii TaxID=171643 RepID=A0A9Q1B6V2_9SAUR|nr:hypothetical protein JRQ81_005878 [Phrynocephalus forsythii]
MLIGASSLEWLLTFLVATRQNRRRSNSKIPVRREGLRFQTRKMSVIAETQNSTFENEMEIELPPSVPTRRHSALPVVRAQSWTSYSSDKCNVQPNGNEMTEEPPQSLRIVSAAIQAPRKSNIVKEMKKNEKSERRGKSSVHPDKKQACTEI